MPRRSIALAMRSAQSPNASPRVRKLTDDELAVLQLTPGEVRLEPAEHG